MGYPGATFYASCTAATRHTRSASLSLLKMATPMAAAAAAAALLVLIRWTSDTKQAQVSLQPSSPSRWNGRHVLPSQLFACYISLPLTIT